MEYLIGSKKEFFDFIDKIDEEDKTVILTHTDLDGIASAVFLQKILEGKEKKVSDIIFLDYRNNMWEEWIFKLEEKEVNKIFISDIAADLLDLEGFEKLREKFDVFLIDHHPINPNLINEKNIIKTASVDCSTYAIYLLGEGILNPNEWGWLVCATIFSEFSYKKLETFEFMKKFYPTITMEDLASSVPGLNSRKISSALIYYENDKRKVFDLVLEKNMEELEQAFEVVEGEIEEIVSGFMEKAEYYPEKKMYIYEIESKFNVASYVTTLVSKMKPDYSFISIVGRGSMLKVSARNQSGKVDMGKLMEKGVFGFENASGGGHVEAAAARFKREDLAKFKENILRE